ncbi:putative metalloprotease CJM1_0395 family protein [Solibacillus silvestris]|uniref:putative metalloprotease CJM1_0395 family protein n=1 Tax=Solibacillus silvestris TaxID=76853 RepID=UPI003F81C31B
MKISSLLHSFNPDLEERRRIQQRKEVGEVYKKHAKYADASKNPMLQALENLLSGKTEKELHVADAAARKDVQQAEKEVIARDNVHAAGATTYTHVTAPDNQRYISSGEAAVQIPSANDASDETLELLEKVRQAALAPAEPSPQDLRIAESASAQIQQVRPDKAEEQMERGYQEETAPFANEDLTFDMPEKFQKDFIRNPDEQTMFGRDLERLLFQRTFNTATQKYSSHIAMVNNGYRPADEPIFSEVA